MPSEHVNNKQKVCSTASSTESFKLPHAGSVSRMAHKLNCFCFNSPGSRSSVARDQIKFGRCCARAKIKTIHMLCVSKVLSDHDDKSVLTLP